MFENKPSKARLIIVSGPSGVGKGTLLKRVFAESNLPLVLSVSATTRNARAGEIDGVHYKFLSPEEFRRKRQNGEFLECFEVYAGGHWYGTLDSVVREELERGNWVVLEIDVKGARIVREKYPDAITVFIEPKSVEVLKERLQGRGTESSESLEKRLAQAQDELDHAEEYEHRIVNDDLETAVTEFVNTLHRISSPS